MPNKSCIEWYDGCNVCPAEEGILGTCTTKVCDKKEKPYCMKSLEENPNKKENPKTNPAELADCDVWFDGCNNCKVFNGGQLACTKKYCEVPTKAFCLTPKIPMDCVSWFDGCNTCSVKDGAIGVCTMMYCETPTQAKCMKKSEKKDLTHSILDGCKVWFNGCNECQVTKGELTACTNNNAKCVNPTKAYCKDKLNPMIINKSGKIPHGCKSWNDGCNTCPIYDQKPYACTKKACVRQGTPHCEAFYAKSECMQWYDGCNACENFDPKNPKWYCTERECATKTTPFCRKTITEFGNMKKKPGSSANYLKMASLGIFVNLITLVTIL